LIPEVAAEVHGVSRKRMTELSQELAYAIWENRRDPVEAGWSWQEDFPGILSSEE
jgi:hypothetical protein